MSLVADWVYEHPWAIKADALETIIAVAERTFSDPELVEKKQAEYIRQTNPDVDPTGRIRDGVGILDVIGPIFPRADWLTNISGATGIDQMARDFTSMMDNPAVKSIILNISSPGGSVEGTSELAQMIYAARDKKPVVAFVQGGAASGAYWIASAASKIYLADTAHVGSIGVVMSYVSTKEKDKNNGIKRGDIVSSASPHKRIDPETDTGLAKIQETVDSLAEVFISTVAKNRGVSPETVKADFGQGWIIIGQDAVDCQMADCVSTFEQVFETLKSQTQSGGLNMSTYTQTDLDSARAAGVAEGKQSVAKITTAVELNAAYPDLCKEIATTGATGERERIQAIETIKAPSAQKLIATHKFDPAHNKSTISVLVLEAEETLRVQAGKDRNEDAAHASAEEVNTNSGDPAASGSAKSVAGGVLPKLNPEAAAQAYQDTIGNGPAAKAK